MCVRGGTTDRERRALLRRRPDAKSRQLVLITARPASHAARTKERLEAGKRGQTVTPTTSAPGYTARRSRPEVLSAASRSANSTRL